MKRRFLIVSLVAVLLLSIGLSYSYFTGQVGDEKKKLEVVAKNVRILFTDDKEISNASIKPGWSEVKSFSVKNESEAVFNYNIVFEKLVNTFVTEGYLKYKIISTDGGFTMEDYIDVPKSSSPTDYVLAYDIDIEPGVTHNYTIEFVYINDENVDQSVDMGKEFSGNLAIIEGSVDPSIKYTVTMNIDESIGEISPTTGESLKKGALDFTVTPNNEYDISTLNVECDPVANVVVLENNIKVNDIRQNHNCNITMNKKKYTVEIKVNNGNSSAKNKIIEHGSSATATITPDYGYTLTGATVTGEGCNLSEGTLTISNVTKPGTCEVTLVKEKYNVTLSGSNVTVSNSPQQVEYQGSTTFTVTPGTGYTLSNAVVNCDAGAESSLGGSTVTVSNVTSATTCTIAPIQLSYDVTLVVNNGTGGSTKTVTHGASTTFSIGANTGYTTSGASISCTGSAGKSISESTVTISNVTATQTCTVTLPKLTYTVSVSSNSTSYGTVSPASQTVEYGNSATVTITPKTGYQYSSNTCGGTVSGNTMTIPNITASKSCSVTFTARTYTVSVSVTGGSSNYSSRSVSYGGSTSFTITADTGYNLSEAGVGGPTGMKCTLVGNILTASNVTNNGTCRVVIPVYTYTVTASVTGGSASPTSATVSYNESTSFTISANSGFAFDGATVSGTGCTLSGRNLIVENVISDTECSVALRDNRECPTSIKQTTTVGPNQAYAECFRLCRNAGCSGVSSASGGDLFGPSTLTCFCYKE